MSAATNKTKLPEDFPGYEALTSAGIKTYGAVRKKIEADELTEISGIGEATAAKIIDAVEAESEFEEGEVEQPTEPTSDEPAGKSDEQKSNEAKERAPEPAKTGGSVEVNAPLPVSVPTEPGKTKKSQVAYWASRGVYIDPDEGPTPKQKILMERLAP